MSNQFKNLRDLVMGLILAKKILSNLLNIDFTKIFLSLKMEKINKPPTIGSKPIILFKETLNIEVMLMIQSKIIKTLSQEYKE